jgi:hypothetical protein
MVKTFERAYTHFHQALRGRGELGTALARTSYVYANLNSGRNAQIMATRPGMRDQRIELRTSREQSIFSLPLLPMKGWI